MFLQVSFERPNLTFRVVNKDCMRDQEGQSTVLWTLVDYIKWAQPAGWL